MARLPFGGQAGAGAAPVAAVYERLATHVAVGVEASHTFTFAPALQGEDWAKILIYITGKLTLSLILELKYNGITSGYFGDGYEIRAGAETLLQQSNLAHWILSTTNMMAGLNNKQIDYSIELTIPDPSQITPAQISAISRATSSRQAMNAMGFSSTHADTDEIDEIIIETSTSTMGVGTKIDVFGVRRVDP